MLFGDVHLVMPFVRSFNHSFFFLYGFFRYLFVFERLLVLVWLQLVRNKFTISYVSLLK